MEDEINFNQFLELLDWNGLETIISKFFQSSDGSTILEEPAQIRLNKLVSFLQSLEQQLADGSIVLSQFRALNLKEKQFTAIISQYFKNSKLFETNTLCFEKSPIAYANLIHDTFIGCRTRLALYNEQRKRILNFVEIFHNFPQIGMFRGFELLVAITIQYFTIKNIILNSQCQIKNEIIFYRVWDDTKKL